MLGTTITIVVVQAPITHLQTSRPDLTTITEFLRSTHHTTTRPWSLLIMRPAITTYTPGLWASIMVWHRDITESIISLSKVLSHLIMQLLKNIATLINYLSANYPATLNCNVNLAIMKLRLRR